VETRSYVALLRGVNVAGRTVASNTLRLAVQALGHQDVTTYIQSGNVVFRTPRDDLERLADEIRLAVADVAGHRVTVILRTAQQLAAVVGSNPFAEACQARALYVTFLEEPPDRDRVQAISPAPRCPMSSGRPARRSSCTVQGLRPVGAHQRLL